MKLALEGNEIDCVARWCDTPQGEGVFWRFISEQGKVWRVRMLDLPGTHILESIDSAVTVKSLLFPVADVIRCVGKYDGTGTKKEIIRLFVTNLLMQFDSDFASRGGESGRTGSNELLPGVPHARRRKIGMGRNVPNEILESVLKLVLGTDANPNIKQCSDLLADIEEVLKDGRLLPAKHNRGDLAFVVKRLATRYTCFAPDNLRRNSTIENELLYQYRLFTGKENSPDKIEAGDEGFLAFLKHFNCVALYAVMGDTRVLPVYRFETEPQEMNREDLKLYSATGRVTLATGAETMPLPTGYNLQTAELPANVKPKKQRMPVAFKLAASICGVTIRTVINWEKGKSTPERYPGRHDAITLKSWANHRATTKNIQKAIKKNLKNTIHLANMDNLK